MNEDGLYARGWRQGAFLEVPLSVSVITCSPEGRPSAETKEHSVWIVASQDCDLDQCDADSEDPVIELRMLHSQDPPTDWGVRSRRHLVAEGKYVVSEDARLHVSPRALVALEDRRRGIPDEDRRGAFKLWLGKRYDRPAVPDPWVPLMERLGLELAKKATRERSREVREVLVQIEEGSPPTYNLVALVSDAADKPDVRLWLADAAQRVPVELGVSDRFQVGTSSEIALDLIETSYSASLIDVTWHGKKPDGAY